MVIRAADIPKLGLGRLLEPFDPECVEVRRHHEHFSMELLRTGGIP